MPVADKSNGANGKLSVVPAPSWERPVTGSQFGHLPLAQRATVTPLLLHRIKQFRLALPKGRPVYDRVYVYPLEGKDADERIEGSVLYKAKRTADKYASSRGVLVKAGIGALEHLWGHGIELGHIVTVARLSPWERRYEGGGGEHMVMILRSSEIVDSEDLEADVMEECIGFKWDDGQLCFADRARTDPPENDEGS